MISADLESRAQLWGDVEEDVAQIGLRRPRASAVRFAVLLVTTGSGTAPARRGFPRR